MITSMLRRVCRELHHGILFDRRLSHAQLFFVVNIVSGKDGGRVRPTTTTRSHNMAAILQLIPSPGLQRTSLIFDIHVIRSIDVFG